MKANLFTKCKPSRVYLNQVPSKTFVHYKNGKVTVVSEDASLEEDIQRHLEKNNLSQVDIKNADALFSFIKDIPDLDNITPSTGFKANKGFCNYEDLKNTKSITELSDEAKNQDLSTIKFSPHTIENGYILVDSREPLALQTMLYNCQINSVDVSQLTLGDVLIGFKEDPVELIIERKTISDLHKSIVGDDHRAHSQVERLYQYTQEKAALGIHVKVIWVIENEGEQTLYNSLNMVKQVDGWVNLSLAICDQYMATSYNLEHTAYLICKFAQGFLERKLTYPVKVAGTRIDTAKPHKLRKNHVSNKDDETGIVLAKTKIASTLSLMPNIPSNVAKELAETGKSLKEILAMSLDELVSIRGVGIKTGTKIYSTFNDVY